MTAYRFHTIEAMNEIRILLENAPVCPDAAAWVRRYLQDEGVPDTVHHLVEFHFAYLIFDERTGSFEFDPTGRPAIVIVPPWEDYPKGPADLVAFDCARPWCFGTLRGEIFALGQSAINNPTTYFNERALQLHQTPLGWLQAGGQGALILQADYSIVRKWFASAPRVLCPDVPYAVDFRDAFRGSVNRPHILVPSRRIAA